MYLNLRYCFKKAIDYRTIKSRLFWTDIVGQIAFGRGAAYCACLERSIKNEMKIASWESLCFHFFSYHKCQWNFVHVRISRYSWTGGLWSAPSFILQQGRYFSGVLLCCCAILFYKCQGNMGSWTKRTRGKCSFYPGKVDLFPFDHTVNWWD